MSRHPLGITHNPPPGQEAVGVYVSSDGVETVDVTAPYSVGMGVLSSPMPVFDAGGPVYYDSMGNARQAMAIKGVAPAGITWDGGATWDDGSYWS